MALQQQFGFAALCQLLLDSPAQAQLAAANGAAELAAAARTQFPADPEIGRLTAEPEPEPEPKQRPLPKSPPKPAAEEADR